MNRVIWELLTRAFNAAIIGLEVHDGMYGMAAVNFTFAVLVFCGSIE